MTPEQSAALTQALLNHAWHQNMQAWIWGVIGTLVCALLLVRMIGGPR